MNPQTQNQKDFKEDSKETKSRRAPQRVLVTSGYESATGKTTLIRHMLLPFMDSYFVATKFIVFSDREQIQKEEHAREPHYSKVLAHMVNTRKGECTIIEVDNTKFDDMIYRMQHGGSDASVNFDKIIVVVRPENFKSKATIGIFMKLMSTGVDPSRIHVVFNSSTKSESEIKEELKKFISWTRIIGINVITLPVMNSEIYGILKERVTRNYEIGKFGFMNKEFFARKLSESRSLAGGTFFKKAVDETNLFVEASEIADGLKKIFNSIFLK